MNNIVVIGAGIVGASIAFHLAKRGAHVIIIDADQPGMQASRVSYAWINARDKNPYGYHLLNRMSQDMWCRFEDRLDADVGLTWGGEMRWSATEQGAMEMRQRVAELQSWGYSIHLVPAKEAAQMEPGINFGNVEAVSFTDSDGHVDPRRVAEACVARVNELGGKIITGHPVVSIDRDRSGKVRAIHTDTSEYACDAVVAAAGAKSGDVAAMAGIKLGNDNSHGATIVTEPIERHIFQRICAMHTPRDLPGVLLNMRQLHDGRVQIHGGTHSGSIADTSLDDAQMLIDETARWLPVVAGKKVEEVRVTTRPVPPDGHPVLGFTNAVPNYYVAFTHSGATLAPLIGETAAIEILDGARVSMLEPYRIERFG